MSEREWLDIFADNLVAIMKDRGVTQSQLSDESGIAESSISYYIRGLKTPGIKAIINISYALDCSVADLVDFGDRIM